MENDVKFYLVWYDWEKAPIKVVANRILTADKSLEFWLDSLDEHGYRCNPKFFVAEFNHNGGWVHAEPVRKTDESND
jgi:hypothetical protein